MKTFMRFAADRRARDVFSGGNVKTIEGYVLLNFEAASVSSFRANQNQPFV